MTGRLLESLQGTGAVHAGEHLLRMTQYDLSVWSPDASPGGGKTSHEGSRIEGHIEITGIEEAVVLAGAGTLTLTLEDGRRLAFQLTSSGGGIAGGRWLP
jgi:hypothetical protein